MEELTWKPYMTDLLGRTLSLEDWNAQSLEYKSFKLQEYRDKVFLSSRKPLDEWMEL